MRNIKLMMITGMMVGMMVFTVGCGSKSTQKVTQEKTGEKITTVSNAGKENNEENTSEQTTENTNDEAGDYTQYDSLDGLPPVDSELKQFYKDAETIFLDVVFSRIECDVEDSLYEIFDNAGNQIMYSKVTDSKYTSMEDLKSELGKYFTEEMVKKLTDNPINGFPRFKEFDGKLYMVQDAKGGNLMYAGHVFEKVTVEDDSMQMPVKVYYAKNATPYEIFYTTPEDLDAYEVKSFTQTLVKVNGEWRFNNFELMY